MRFLIWAMQQSLVWVEATAQIGATHYIAYESWMKQQQADIVSHWIQRDGKCDWSGRGPPVKRPKGPPNKSQETDWDTELWKLIAAQNAAGEVEKVPERMRASVGGWHRSLRKEQERKREKTSFGSSLGGEIGSVLGGIGEGLNVIGRVVGLGQMGQRVNVGQP